MMIDTFSSHVDPAVAQAFFSGFLLGVILCVSFLCVLFLSFFGPRE